MKQMNFDWQLWNGRKRSNGFFLVRCSTKPFMEKESIHGVRRPNLFRFQWLQRVDNPFNDAAWSDERSFGFFQKREFK